MGRYKSVKVLRLKALKLNKAVWSNQSLQEVLLYLDNSDVMTFISARKAMWHFVWLKKDFKGWVLNPLMLLCMLELKPSDGWMGGSYGGVLEYTNMDFQGHLGGRVSTVRRVGFSSYTTRQQL